MNVYRCRGTVVWRIDRTVIAESPAHAAQLISDDYTRWPLGMEEGVGEEHISAKLRITKETEEQRMLAAGHPQLFQEAP